MIFDRKMYQGRKPRVGSGEDNPLNLPTGTQFVGSRWYDKSWKTNKRGLSLLVGILGKQKAETL